MFKNIFSNRKFILIIILAAILLLSLRPVKTICGVSGATCAYPSDNPEHTACWYTEIEPLGVKVVETMVQYNLRIFYSSDTVCS